MMAYLRFDLDDPGDRELHRLSMLGEGLMWAAMDFEEKLHWIWDEEDMGDTDEARALIDRIWDLWLETAGQLTDRG